MKKIISLVLCVALLALVGCSGGSVEDGSDTKAPENSAIASGKIEGIEFGLGADVSAVKQHYSSLAEDYQQNHSTEDDHQHNDYPEDYAYYDLFTKGEYSVIDISDARFYYLTENEEKGIVAVATDSATFGYTPGVTTKYEVEETEQGESETLNAGEEELDFLAVRQEAVIVLRYEYGDYQLDYYFYDNLLITTVLRDMSK